MAKGITSREKDYAQWYIDVVLRSELADYSPVKGCMVIRPNGYGIWENIQKNLDRMFKETGHVNAYFPMFIPESFLKKEAEHVKGFASECAVVTHAGGKKLEEPLVIRPTSETIIWSKYKDWIKSHRDLPLLINQWANVCRWEMRTRLFLRTTEFLWQEGHTAHATEEEAREEALRMVHLYKTFVEEYIAMPVEVGLKTEKEKFAGAIETYSIEAMMQDGKALQAGTSHYLGQNFAKAFDVQFQDVNNKLQYVFATSWGVSTRLIGAMVMSHSDDNGLIIPPKLAPVPVVIVPIWRSDEEQTLVTQKVHEFTSDWDPLFFKFDVRDHVKPGRKFNEWELKGVPIRIEVGPRDCENDEVVIVRRDLKDKTSFPTQGLREKLVVMLDEMQTSMFERAKERMSSRTRSVDDFEEYKSAVKEGGFYRIHWCGDQSCEDNLQNETKSTIRCIPFDVPEESGSCLLCGRPSRKRVLAAQSY